MDSYLPTKWNDVVMQVFSMCDWVKFQPSHKLNEQCCYKERQAPILIIYSQTCLSWTPLGLKTLFVQFRQVFGLHRFKLHGHLVDETVKSVWIRQVFGLLRVQLHGHLVDETVKSIWFRQVFGFLRVRFRQVSLYIIYLIFVTQKLLYKDCKGYYYKHLGVCPAYF